MINYIIILTLYTLYIFYLSLNQNATSSPLKTPESDEDSDADDSPPTIGNNEDAKELFDNADGSQDSSSESDEDEDEDEEGDYKLKRWGDVTSTGRNPSLLIIEQMFNNGSADSVHVSSKHGNSQVYDLTEKSDVKLLHKLLRSSTSRKGLNWHLRSRVSQSSSAKKQDGSFAPGFELESEEEDEIDSDDDSSSEDDVQVGKSKGRAGRSALVDSGSESEEDDQSDSDSSSDSDEVEVVEKQSKKKAAKGKKMNH